MKYFYLISSLPEIRIEDRSLTQEYLDELIALIGRNLDEEDRPVYQALLASGDNQNLLYVLFREYHDFEIARFKRPYAIAPEILENYRHNYAFLPDYMINYLNDFSGSFASLSLREMEQNLDDYFHEHVIKLNIPFLSTYYDWRIRLKGIIADLNARSYGFLKKQNEATEKAFPHSRTLHGVTDFEDVANQMLPLIESNDLETIEAKVNTFYWEFASCWQEPFSSDQVFANLIKIIRMHRWKGFVSRGVGAKEKFEMLIHDLKIKESSPKMPLI
ncbi:DUF2764 family protein [Ekhidna sp.]|uniref:DUF2764 family protein n=1 Tax=Ekhidna sp. TaxID=2608089 RepID=UPI003B511914